MKEWVWLQANLDVIKTMNCYCCNWDPNTIIILNYWRLYLHYTTRPHSVNCPTLLRLECFSACLSPPSLLYPPRLKTFLKAQLVTHMVPRKATEQTLCIDGSVYGCYILESCSSYLPKINPTTKSSLWIFRQKSRKRKCSRWVFLGLEEALQEVRGE